jgi:hypothetical protein
MPPDLQRLHVGVLGGGDHREVDLVEPLRHHEVRHLFGHVHHRPGHVSVGVGQRVVRVEDHFGGGRVELHRLHADTSADLARLPEGAGHDEAGPEGLLARRADRAGVGDVVGDGVEPDPGGRRSGDGGVEGAEHVSH